MLTEPMEECGTLTMQQLVQLLQRRMVSAAAFTATQEAKIQNCQNQLTGTDLASTMTTIQVVLVSTRINGTSAGYTPEKATQLLDAVNDANARSGFSFALAQLLDDVDFASAKEANSRTCFTAEGGLDEACRRCQVYKSVPANLQTPTTAFIYMVPAPPTQDAGPVNTGAAYLPQGLYDALTSSPQPGVCVDGLYSLARPGGIAGEMIAAVTSDAPTVIHEVGTG